MEIPEHLRTDHAHALGDAMLEARQALNVANEKYQHSLAIVMGTEVNADGMLALRNEGRAYAAAITGRIVRDILILGWQFIAVPTGTTPGAEHTSPASPDPMSC